MVAARLVLSAVCVVATPMKRRSIHGRRAHPGVGILGRERRQQLLRIVLERVHRGRPHQRVLMLPLGLAAESIEQAHGLRFASAVTGQCRSELCILGA